MIKRITLFVLILSICFTFIGCNKKDDSKAKTDDASTSKGYSGLAVVEMKEQVIYDKNNVVITAKSLDFKETLVPDHSNPSSPGKTVNTATLNLEVQNKNNYAVQISSHSFDVNGITFGQDFTAGVVDSGACPAEGTSNILVEIPRNTAKINKVEIIKEITMRLKIEKCHLIEDDPDAGDYYSVDGVIDEDTKDLKIVTEGNKHYVQPVDTEGTLLFDENDVKFVFQSFAFEEDGKALFKAYCENNRNDHVRVRVEIIKINGKEFDESDKATMPMESKGCTGFFVSKSDLEGFDKLESIEFQYTVLNGIANHFETLITKSEPIVIDLTK